YPDESPKTRDRLPLEAIFHHEYYQEYSLNNIQTLYQQNEIDGMKRYQQDTELKAMIEAAGAQNLAQVYTKVKYTRHSHLNYSRSVLNYLVEQGFLNH